MSRNARALVERAARPDAELLADCDLRVADLPATPQRLEQRIAEAQCQQVLDRLLAEIVIDAVDLPLRDHGADDGIDPARRLAVLAERFLEHDARRGRHDARLRELAADRLEQVGRGRQEEEPHHLLAAGEQAHERAIVDGDGRVDARVAEQRRKVHPARGVEVRADVLAASGLGGGEVLLARQRRARHGDNPALRRQLSVGVATVQRGQELAHRKVAGAAEQDEVERRGRRAAGGGCGGAVGLTVAAHGTHYAARRLIPDER